VLVLHKMQKMGLSALRCRGTTLIAVLSLACSHISGAQDILSSLTSENQHADLKTAAGTHVDTKSIDIGEMVNIDTIKGANPPVVWERRFSQNNTRYIRLLFDTITAPANSRFTLRVLHDPAGSAIASYSAAEFTREERFLTGLLPPGAGRVQLIAEQIPTGLSFRLARIFWQARSTVAVPESNLIKLRYVQSAGEKVKALAKSVALLHIGPKFDEDLTTCTGVLVATNVIATNYHCIEHSLSFLKTENTDRPSCGDVSAEFDYLVANERGVTATCLAVRAVKGLDLALLTIEGTPNLPNRSPIRLRDKPPAPPDTVLLVHHPLGLPLSVEERCATIRLETSDVLHDCQTENGSSGSPIIDGDLNLLGIHYAGPYPDWWTIEMVQSDYLLHGPRYNKAISSVAFPVDISR
jgi:hypothetical protein